MYLYKSNNLSKVTQKISGGGKLCPQVTWPPYLQLTTVSYNLSYNNNNNNNGIYFKWLLLCVWFLEKCLAHRNSIISAIKINIKGEIIFHWLKYYIIFYLFFCILLACFQLYFLIFLTLTGKYSQGNFIMCYPCYLSNSSGLPCVPRINPRLLKPGFP